jgi:hypothetical protein
MVLAPNLFALSESISGGPKPSDKVAIFEPAVTGFRLARTAGLRIFDFDILAETAHLYGCRVSSGAGQHGVDGETHAFLKILDISAEFSHSSNDLVTPLRRGRVNSYPAHIPFQGRPWYPCRTYHRFQP